MIFVVKAHDSMHRLSLSPPDTLTADGINKTSTTTGCDVMHDRHASMSLAKVTGTREVRT